MPDKYRLYRYDGFDGQYKLVMSSNNLESLVRQANITGTREWKITEVREVTVKTYEDVT